MELEFIPHTSIGPINFEMTRKEVHDSLKKYMPEIDLEVSIDGFKDSFDRMGIYVSYHRSHPNGCYNIVVYSPNKLLLNNRGLMSNSIASSKQWLEEQGKLIEVYTEAIVVPSLGLILGTPSYDLFKKRPPEVIGIFDENERLSGCFGKPKDNME